MLEEWCRGDRTRAALQGHRAAGKNGYGAEGRSIRGGYGDKRLASFLGFAPADGAALAILVVIDEPEGKGSEGDGGAVAAPVWGASPQRLCGSST